MPEFDMKNFGVEGERLSDMIKKFPVNVVSGDLMHIVYVLKVIPLGSVRSEEMDLMINMMSD